MNDQVYNHFRELSWRRKLTPSEEAELRAWLVANPEAQRDWELELGLSEALGQLSAAPVSSNFTARVLEAVEKDGRRQRQSRVHPRRWWPRLALRVSMAGLLAAAALICYHQAHKAHVREELRRSVAAIAEVNTLPSTEALENFEAIRLSAEPAADEKLLSLLQ